MFSLYATMSAIINSFCIRILKSWPEDNVNFIAGRPEDNFNFIAGRVGAGLQGYHNVGEIGTILSISYKHTLSYPAAKIIYDSIISFQDRGELLPIYLANQLPLLRNIVIGVAVDAAVVLGSYYYSELWRHQTLSKGDELTKTYAQQAIETRKVAVGTTTIRDTIDKTRITEADITKLQDTPQFKALKLGVSVETAMKIDSDDKFGALKVVLANGQPAEDAAGFTAANYKDYKETPQFKALKLGVPVTIAMQINSHDKYAALEVVLKNNQPAEDAVGFTAANYKDYKETPQFKALNLGVKVSTAMEIEKESQYNALVLLGKDRANLASKFTSDDKFGALKVVLANGQPAEDAAGFTAANYKDYKETPQFKALKLGVKVSTAMEINSDDKFGALKVVLANGQPAEDALGFTAANYKDYKETPQFSALKLGISVEDAMETESYEQLDCVETHLHDNYLPCLGITADDVNDAI